MGDRFDEVSQAFTTPSETEDNDTNDAEVLQTEACDVFNLLGSRVDLRTTMTTSDDFGSFVNKMYSSSMPKCEDLVQKWHARTQVDTNVLNKKLNKKTTQLSSLQQPILTQVCKALENKKFIGKYFRSTLKLISLF